MSGPFLYWSPRKSGLMALPSTVVTVNGKSATRSHPLVLSAAGASFAKSSMGSGRVTPSQSPAGPPSTRFPQSVITTRRSRSRRLWFLGTPSDVPHVLLPCFSSRPRHVEGPRVTLSEQLVAHVIGVLEPVSTRRHADSRETFRGDCPSNAFDALSVLEGNAMT